MSGKPSGQKQEIVPNETIFLSNVPQKDCSIPSLFQHFKNYGHIRSIYAFGTYANVTFDTVDESIRAFKSPEAYANNRFVHYHYHRHPETAESLLSVVVDKQHVQEVLSEVRENIAQEQRRVAELQQSMINSQATTQNSSEVELIEARGKLEKQLDYLQTLEENDSIKAEKQKLLDYINTINNTLEQS